MTDSDRYLDLPMATRKSKINTFKDLQDWLEEMTSNLYKIKEREEESKYKKEKMMKEL